MTDYRFIQAKNYTPTAANPLRKVDLICIHTMEAKEKPGTAALVARWFAGPTAPKASAHYCVDGTEVIQCVAQKDVAWAAPGANRNGLHIEMAGYAAQSESDWSDMYSLAMLELVAKLTAELCQKYYVPIVKLTSGELTAGKRGICGHADVSMAFHKSNHTDPGKNFPWETFLEVVRSIEL